MAATKLTPEEKRRKHADYMREYMRNSPIQRERMSARYKKWRLAHMDEERQYKREWRAKNPAANHASRKRYKRRLRMRATDPVLRIRLLVRDAKRRAKKIGLEFDGSLSAALQAAPPVECPSCRNPLDYSIGVPGGGPRQPTLRAPSLDRMENAKGYTVANVRVICFRCNRVKNDATLEELEAVAAYMRRG